MELQHIDGPRSLGVPTRRVAERPDPRGQRSGPVLAPPVVQRHTGPVGHRHGLSLLPQMPHRRSRNEMAVVANRRQELIGPVQADTHRKRTHVQAGREAGLGEEPRPAQFGPHPDSRRQPQWARPPFELGESRSVHVRFRRLALDVGSLSRARQFDRTALEDESGPQSRRLSTPRHPAPQAPRAHTARRDPFQPVRPDSHAAPIPAVVGHHFTAEPVAGHPRPSQRRHQVRPPRRERCPEAVKVHRKAVSGRHQGEPQPVLLTGVELQAQIQIVERIGNIEPYHVHGGPPSRDEPARISPGQRSVRCQAQPQETQPSGHPHARRPPDPLPRGHHPGQRTPMACRHRSLVELRGLDRVRVEEPEHTEHVVRAEHRGTVQENAHLVGVSAAHEHRRAEIVEARHPGDGLQAAKDVGLHDRRNGLHVGPCHSHGTDRDLAVEHLPGQLARLRPLPVRAHRERRQLDRGTGEEQIDGGFIGREGEDRIQPGVREVCGDDAKGIVKARREDGRARAVRETALREARQRQQDTGNGRFRRRVQGSYHPPGIGRFLGGDLGRTPNRRQSDSGNGQCSSHAHAKHVPFLIQRHVVTPDPAVARIGLHLALRERQLGSAGLRSRAKRPNAGPRCRIRGGGHCHHSNLTFKTGLFSSKKGSTLSL